VIHRHGMDERTAFEVEAALIDAIWPDEHRGRHGQQRPWRDARQGNRQRYAAEPAVFDEKALLISVNRSAAERSLYEATTRRPATRGSSMVEVEEGHSDHTDAAGPAVPQRRVWRRRMRSPAPFKRTIALRLPS
jgi:hypothetical protein